LTIDLRRQLAISLAHVSLLAGVSTCGGRVSNEHSPDSTGGALTDDNGVVCDEPGAVESFSIDPVTGARADGKRSEACLQLRLPDGVVRDDAGSVDSLCFTVPRGDHAELSMKIQVDRDESPGGLVFGLTNGSSDILDVTAYVEHDGGSLRCPTTSGANSIHIAGRFAQCFELSSDGRPIEERCPCSGVAPESLASIRSLRWEVTHGGAISLGAQLCLYRTVYLCGGDCQSFL
jgi:hypothetical protein